MLLVALVPTALVADVDYPRTRQVDHVDAYNGIEVADPYRWLENDIRTDPEVAAWVRAQNEVTSEFLKAIAERAKIKDRLTELWNHPSYSAPFKEGGRYFVHRNDGLQNHDVLYAHDDLNGDPQLLLDPNTWSEDGSLSLADITPSPDGRYLAYGIREAGSDWRTLRVLDLRTGEHVDGDLKWVKYSEEAWTRDGQGFFYARFAPPIEGVEYQAISYNQKLCYHRVGRPQSDDVLVFEMPHEPEWTFGVHVSHDGRHLIITVWDAGHVNLVYHRDLQQPYACPTELIGGWDAEYTFVGSDGPILFFWTNSEAPMGRLVAVDTRSAERENWRTIIPESPDALRRVSLIGGMFVARYLQDAKTRVRVYSLAGERIRDVDLPGIGSASGFKGRPDDPETFYAYSSYDTPKTIYHYDVTTGKSTPWRRSEIDFDPAPYEVEQVFYASKDGTRIPMFLVQRRDIDLDGGNPTVLTGYGGFNIAIAPYFSTANATWLEMGGTLAVANLRGGGEYGEAWHQAGSGLQKQNTFDDFIAAAEWIIENGYAKPEGLAIKGSSNGGLLTGAVLMQRPDLFGAAVVQTGVLDMLRFHKFTAGRFWTVDYGSAEDPEEFIVLYGYSPYHNVRESVAYPATLITTADTDDRVVPGHSFKFAAALQNAQAGSAPILLRTETRAGHGGGTPTSKRIDEAADVWAFVAAALGMTIEWD